MPSDEVPAPEGPPPVRKPAREPRREPPVIDARAEPDVDTAKPAAEAAAAEASQPDESVPEDTGPRRSMPAYLLPLGGFGALLILAVLAYVAWQDADATAAAQADVSDLRGRLEKLEAAAGRPAVAPDQVATLDRRMSALEQRPSPAPPAPGVSPAALEALQTRVAAVERTARDAVGAAADARQSAQDRPAPAPAPAVDLGPIETRLGSLEGRLGAIEQQLDAPKTAVRATEEPIAPGTRPGDQAALAVVAQTILMAVEAGRPFTTEMAAAQAVGADAAALAPLKPLADKGAPTRDALARSFDAVADATARAAQPEAPTGESLMDRLGASAARLVRVRPVGEPAGEDAPALVARIEAALARGDTAAAVAAWDKLPAAAKTASTGFADLARRRLAAETAARGLLQTAMAALARPRGSQ